jgi:diadenosine tetraphosphate (Ap4A) HIT family hydrolase
MMPIVPPDMDPCVLCEHIQGKRLDWLPIDEGEHFVTILVPQQFEVGQVISITKRHVPFLHELRDEEAHAIILAAQRVSRAMIKAFDPDGITMYQNSGAWAGQVTPHFHFHVVPRRPDSNWGLGPPHLAHFMDEERKARGFERIELTEDKRRTAELLRRHL